MKQKIQTILDESNVKRTKPSQSERLEHHRSQSAVCESDSGFSSGRSSPVSGRSSPLMSVSPVEAQTQSLVQTGSELLPRSLVQPSPQTAVVSLDCEMVGTGPGGRVSEVARCSVIDYHGNVLFDEYIRPIGQITDYRSPWSGIRKHHLTKAMPFSHARDRVQSLLDSKVLVGHSVQFDLKSLDLVHPGHMIRDTSCTHLLTRLAGFPREHRPSLKALTNRLLHRKIQVGSRGHCSVEDASAALDLYKLVEGEWEREAELSLRDEQDPTPPSYASSQHFLNDEYWPSL
ncbi:apoptosis-enhancing nuclease isoform X2 [Periophthalmus magnuspinnatus]|uniref:apoptosis-enhancing nuclease isoform X2 n=1 Tax=Periophthalmus magnuspinnatus TaxID=409849 RepID=UPI00145A111B|nr:apoptosis-enhancing nuclease isoform X2 [Periophthalmus magnuspinnatus]